MSESVALIIALPVGVIFVILSGRLAGEDSREAFRIRLVVGISIALRIGIATVWFLNVGHSLGGESTSDAQSYWADGTYLAQQFRDLDFDLPRLSSEITHEYFGYPLFLGTVFSIGGDQQMLGSFANQFLVVGAGLLAYAMARRYLDPRAGMPALVLNMFYPQYLSAGFFLLKDILITFITVLITFATLEMRNPSKTVKRGVLFLLGVAALMFLRRQMAVMLGFIGVTYLALSLLNRNTVRARTRLLGVLAGVVIGVIILGSVVTWQDRSVLSSWDEITTQVVIYRVEQQDLLVGAQSPQEALDRSLDNPGVFAFHVAQSAILTFWGPTNWYARNDTSIHPIWENMGAMMLTVIMPFVLLGLFRALRQRPLETMPMWGLVLATFMSVVFAGGITRWRLPMMPVVFGFGAYGLLSWRRWRALYPMYLVLFAALAIYNWSPLIGQITVIGTLASFAVTLGATLLLQQRSSLRRRFSVRKAL